MDDAALQKCQEFFLICVPMGVPSVLHKYTVAALAAHLGIDVLYCDLDAVPLGADPFGKVLEAVGDADLAVSTHNYDCLNAGVWFARASDATAKFFLVLLEYLYDHWYEGDQRSFNALATGNVSVSFQNDLKSRMPPPGIAVVVLSPDLFVGTEGFADVEAVQLFHAYKLYGAEKLDFVMSLYGAHDLPLDAWTSRQLLWDWAANSLANASWQASMHAVLRPYQKLRESSACW